LGTCFQELDTFPKFRFGKLAFGTSVASVSPILSCFAEKTVLTTIGEEANKKELLGGNEENFSKKLDTVTFVPVTFSLSPVYNLAKKSLE